ncbi:MAG: DUF5690 family protein [Cyclobacteriaceae bacterium]|jgi:MFS family permease|nr:DUF5690 family protein [Cyclobacteriaceae bacterium]
MTSPHPLTRWLSTTHTFWFGLYTAATAFCLYTCIFALRKAFGVATYQGLEWAGASFKVWMVISQMLGYMLSKFIGIKVVSELGAQGRAKGILLMVSIATVAWLLFALTPAPYNLIFIFLNGLPLGMVWGMVFGYLEGRKTTEVLGASLSVSFIFSDGFAKTIGGWTMAAWGVSELWMPFVTAALFFVPLLIFLFLLDKIPPPSAEDETLRTKRLPMTGRDRWHFSLTFLPGLVFLVLAYMMLTIFRDFRSNFSADIFKLLNIQDTRIFIRTESMVSVVVLVVIASLMAIKNNYRALVINHAIVLAGMGLVGLGMWLFEQRLISPTVWMVMIGMGLYFGYIQFNSIFFDRLIATFRIVSTVGFLIYLADSVGYVGSMGVVLFKEFGSDQNWLDFFISAGYVVSVAGSVLITGSFFYFRHKYTHWPKN